MSAESIISDILSKMLTTLGSNAYKKIMFARSLDSHIQKLHDLKTTVQATLLDADLLESCTNSQQDFFNKLRSALVDLDDFLDETETRAQLKEVIYGNKFIKAVRVFFSESNQLYSPLRDAHKLKAIVERFDAIAKNHAHFGTLTTIANPPVLNHKRLCSGQINDLVVGRDKERDNIVGVLSEGSMALEKLSVSSIVGIGGMGKTTLAWYVYNDQRVRNMFEVQFWVSATQDFDFNKVLEKIILSGDTGEKPLDWDMDQLYHHFRRAIDGKKFLLVLDNMWDQDSLRGKWVRLRSLLELGANGSQVLLTTRDTKVSGLMDCANTCKIRDLREYDSWLIFKRIAFTRLQEPGVEAIGEQIARMCHKVPLVIWSIASHLAEKRTVREWQAFRDDQLAHFTSYGRDIKQTLKLSYDHLDENLKLCVCYCSLFPKGFRFDPDNLIYQWMALGYIESHDKNQNLEDVGREYVYSLIGRGFFCLSYVGEELVMNDLVYDLVVWIAGYKYKMVDEKTNEIDARVHHLSIDHFKLKSRSIKWNVPSSIMRLKSLKSFIHCLPLYCGLPPIVDDILITRLPCLRVLYLENLNIKKLPESLGKLRCLSYLNLSYNYMVELPTSIKYLKNLVYLNLSGCDFLQKLSMGICNLMMLRYLNIQHCRALTSMPMGLGNLANLRFLNYFVVGDQSRVDGGDSYVMSTLEELNRLNNLNGELVIDLRGGSECTVAEARKADLKRKESLTSITISFGDNIEVDEEMVLESLVPNANLRRFTIKNYEGDRLPKWIRDELHIWLPNLISINLFYFCSCKYLCSFGRLPHLKRLKLIGLYEVEYIESINDSSSEAQQDLNPLFPRLDELVICGMPKLKGMWRMSMSRQSIQVKGQNHHLIDWKHVSPFPKLKTLEMDNMNTAITIAKSASMGLTSLQKLIIDSKAYNIDEHQQQPHPQEAFVLRNNLFPNLCELQIWNYEFEILHEEFRYCSAIQELSIGHCERFQALPEWIDSLTSLTRIEINNCPRFETLPYQISHLSKLQFLEITNCSSLLKEKCQSPTGEYWPLIQHIPFIYID
ncbi:unnamed protein product [Amaranthus hypochondriacus]